MITYNPVVQGMGTGQVELPERVDQSLPIDVSGISNIAQSYASNVMAEADAEARWAAMVDAKNRQAEADARQAKEDAYKDERMQMAREKHAMAIESHQWGAEKMEYARNSEARKQYNFELEQSQLADGRTLAKQFSDLNALREQTGMSMAEFSTRARQIKDNALDNSSLSASQIDTIYNKGSNNIQGKLLDIEIDDIKDWRKNERELEKSQLDNLRKSNPVYEDMSYGELRQEQSRINSASGIINDMLEQRRQLQQYGGDIAPGQRQQLEKAETFVGTQAAAAASAKLLSQTRSLSPVAVADITSQITKNFIDAGENPNTAAYIAQKAVRLAGLHLPQEFAEEHNKAVAKMQWDMEMAESPMFNAFVNAPKEYKPLINTLLQDPELAAPFHQFAQKVANGSLVDTTVSPSGNPQDIYSFDSLDTETRRVATQVAPAIVDSPAATPTEKTNVMLSLIGTAINAIKNAGSQAVEMAADAASNPERAVEELRNSDILKNNGKKVNQIARKGNPAAMTPELRDSVTRRLDTFVDEGVGQARTALGDKWKNVRYDPATESFLLLESSGEGEKGMFKTAVDYMSQNYELEVLGNLSDTIRQSSRYATDDNKGHKARIRDILKYYEIQPLNKDEENNVVSPNVLTSVIQTSKEIAASGTKVLSAGVRAAKSEVPVSEFTDALAEFSEDVTGSIESGIESIKERTNKFFKSTIEETREKYGETAYDTFRRLFESDEDYYKRHPEARGAMEISNIENEELFQ